jgi:hypothetical protein
LKFTRKLVLIHYLKESPKIKKALPDPNAFFKKYYLNEKTKKERSKK